MSWISNMFGSSTDLVSDEASILSLPYPFSPILKDSESRSLVLDAKDRGNVAFQSGQYPTAIQEYSTALSYFVPENSTKQSEEYLTILTFLLANRSQAYLCTYEYQKAFVDAVGVTKYRPDWVKGWYRKGEALLGLRQFESAVSSLKNALALDPQNARVQARLHKARYHLEDDQAGVMIHQLFPGREICRKSMFSPFQSFIYNYASDLRNFIYLIGNRSSNQCLVVDICWDVDGVLAYAVKHGLEIVGAIVTHYHIDHIGGIPPPPFDKFGVRIDGIAKLAKRIPNLVIYAHEDEIQAIIKGNPEMTISQFTPMTDHHFIFLPMKLNDPDQSRNSSKSSLPNNGEGEQVTLFEFLHTPGHTPGSQCVLVNGSRLFSGDTLFIKNCGRLDFPDCSKEAMYTSLQEKLRPLNDSIVVYPGHDYGGDYTTIGQEKQGGLLRPLDKFNFLAKY